MNKKRLNLIISLLIGLGIFGFFLYRLGPESILLITRNINFFYLLIFFVLTTLTFFLIAWRWQVILRAYKKRVSFFTIVRQTLAGYAVSYVTPFERLGGEPLRAYMLKKEAKVDLKTGISSIIMDKFVELTGAGLFGFLGWMMLLYLREVSSYLKLILALLLAFTFSLLFVFYYRTITGKGSFSSLFNFFRLYKIIKSENFFDVLENVEKKMKKFFSEHKKEFLFSFLIYLLYGIIVIFEFKFLFLSFGVDASLIEIVLTIVVFGFVSFIPVPASLGFLEAGQSGLFMLLRGQGNIGFALSLILRLRALIFVAIGFAIISYFSGKQISSLRKNIKTLKT